MSAFRQSTFAAEILGDLAGLTGPHRSSAKIINYLHGGVTPQTVPGRGEVQRRRDDRRRLHVHPPVADGACFVQVLAAGAAGSVAIVNPQPAWGKG